MSSIRRKKRLVPLAKADDIWMTKVPRKSVLQKKIEDRLEYLETSRDSIQKQMDEMVWKVGEYGVYEQLEIDLSMVEARIHELSLLL